MFFQGAQVIEGSRVTSMVMLGYSAKLCGRIESEGKRLIVQGLASHAAGRCSEGDVSNGDAA